MACALPRTCKAPGPTVPESAETLCAPAPTGPDVICTLAPRQGGHFDWARYLMSRFGLMDEATFGGDGFEDKGLRAANRIRDSLSTGALKTAAARRDRALVRRELDRAWGLSSSTVKAMNDAFGSQGPAELVAFARSSGPIQSASDLPVQRALNDRQALPIEYWNERSALDSQTATYSAERVVKLGPRMASTSRAVRRCSSTSFVPPPRGSASREAPKASSASPSRRPSPMAPSRSTSTRSRF